MRFRVSKEELMKHFPNLEYTGQGYVPLLVTLEGTPCYCSDGVICDHSEGVPEATTGEKNVKVEPHEEWLAKAVLGDKPTNWVEVAPKTSGECWCIGFHKYIPEYTDGEKCTHSCHSPKSKCCAKCVGGGIPRLGISHCMNLGDCACHSVTEECHCQPGYKWLTHRVTEVKHIGDDKCYGQPCNHDGTTKCGLPVTAKEGEKEEIAYCTCDDIEWRHRHTGPHYPFKVPRPTSTQKIEEVEPLTKWDGLADFNGKMVQKLNEVIRALNRVA